MGRPRKGETRTHCQISVRVSTHAADALAKLSLRRGVSIYALTGQIVDRTILHWITTQQVEDPYTERQSTVGWVMGHPASGAR